LRIHVTVFDTVDIPREQNKDEI